MKLGSSRKSHYLNRYMDFMGESGHHYEDPSREVLKRYRAELISAHVLARRRRRFDLRLIYASENASTASYIVELGRFSLTINLLNLQAKAPSQIGDRTMGSGAFGTVLIKNVANT